MNNQKIKNKNYLLTFSFLPVFFLIFFLFKIIVVATLVDRISVQAREGVVQLKEAKRVVIKVYFAGKLVILLCSVCY